MQRTQKLPRFLYRTSFVYRWMFTEDKRELQSSAALNAFEIAGEHGQKEAPALTSLMLTASSESAGVNAAYALAYIGGAGRVRNSHKATWTNTVHVQKSFWSAKSTETPEQNARSTVKAGPGRPEFVGRWAALAHVLHCRYANPLRHNFVYRVEICWFLMF